MPVAPIHILVVEDFEPWRRSLRSMLKRRADVRIVGEAADGLEAVQKTSELKPDLVLLDISLPTLNGIEAAKRILQNVPTKVLFITLNSDAEVVQAALNTGAKGYLLQSDAGSELWPAIEAVLQGKQYVSSGVLARVQAEISRLS